ncbi:MAG: diacylglycerol kinase family lipid kinase [Clostridia bacterium]|nr:diacylglycerol kinase family lipid kinase [Clostridia bacterium]
MAGYYFVVNPVAGAGKCSELFTQTMSVLDSRGVAYSYGYTGGTDDAVHMAHDAALDGYDAVVAVGGDGTAQDVARGVYGTGAPMMVFPFGTGNDFARALRIPTGCDECVEVLLSGFSRNVDIGRANGNLFLNVSGFGFDTDVLKNTEEYKKRYTGMKPYLLGIVKTMLHLNRMQLTVEADDRVLECESLLIAVANGTHFGGGMNVSPASDPFDGYFDVCLIRSISFPLFISLLPQFVKGKHIGKKPVEYFKTKRLAVSSSVEYELNLDGELKSVTPALFEIEESAIPMIIPAQAWESEGA